MTINYKLQPTVNSWLHSSSNSSCFIEFTDISFAADISSIDGRPANSSTTDLPGFCCHCKLPCKQKQVFKDGPNQGRHYLCCPKSVGSCSYFIWSDQGTSNTAHQNISWKRFKACDGWKFVSSRSPYNPEHILQGYSFLIV